MVDCFNGLGHNTVIRRNNKDCNIGAESSSGAHGGERFMTGGVKEGDVSAALGLNSVCTDVLGDAAGFACGNVRLTDNVKDGGFAVVNVTHYAYNRVAGNKIARVVLAVVNKAVFYGHNYLVLNLCADIHGNKGGGVIIYGFVDGNHHALHHKALDNLRGGYFQLERKVTHGDFVRKGDFKLLAALAFHFKFFKLCLLLLFFALLRLALLF